MEYNDKTRYQKKKIVRNKMLNDEKKSFLYHVYCAIQVNVVGDNY